MNETSSVIVMRHDTVASLLGCLSARRWVLIHPGPDRGNMSWSWKILGMQLEQFKENPTRLGTPLVHRETE